MNTAGSLAKDVGITNACNALVIPRASFYRWRERDRYSIRDHCHRVSPLALTDDERKAVLDILHDERFVDQAPQEVYAALLDEGVYMCSVRTMYRILEENQEVRERRNQLRHPHYKKPEILATAPNQVWSWDITKLRGPVKWTYYYLYVILDIFSRYVVGWMVARREKAALARKLIEQSCEKQGIQQDQLIIHSDRGPSMTSKPVALLLADLGVTKSHSRPYVSNDNPYSESQFKTMKYRPDFPGRFGCIEDSRSFCQDFFGWYNTEHYHSGIGFLTPEDVHYGRAEQIIKEREKVLKTAFERHPNRFKGKVPKPMVLP
ncbi:MAG: IS3 family transposase [Deltaproteobacteria bacterium]|nr:IS3 family transposase [Deltaproteobacteria bacterium]